MHKKHSRNAILLAWGIYAVLCAKAVFAAPQYVLIPDDLPAIQLAYASLLSAFGGAASTLQRWARAEEKGAWYILLGRDVFCSQAAGLVTFFLALYATAPPMLAASGVVLTAWAGARFLDFAYAKAEGYLGIKTDRAANRPDPQDKP